MRTQRLYFLQAFARPTPCGEMHYLPGHFYNVEDELAAQLIADGVALTEQEHEARQLTAAAALAEQQAPGLAAPEAAAEPESKELKEGGC